MSKYARYLRYVEYFVYLGVVAIVFAPRFSKSSKILLFSSN